MCQLQKLLYILGLMVVGTTILVGVQKFITSHKVANIYALTLDILDIAVKFRQIILSPNVLLAAIIRSQG